MPALLAEIDIGPLTLQTFGLLFALSFLAAGTLVARRFAELGKPVDWAYEMGFAALVGGVVGARLAYILENLDAATDDLLGTVFSGEGLVWYGGAIGGALAVIAWAWWRDYLRWTLLDLAAPALALGYAVGRVGCQVSGDGDYGTEWDGPWAMAYPDGVVPIDEAVHPTPVYETVAMTSAAVVLWHLRDRLRPGGLFSLYLVFAGVERFAVEFLRRNDPVALGLTLPQLQSAVMAIAGAALLYWLARRPGGLRSPEAGPRPAG